MMVKKFYYISILLMTAFAVYPQVPQGYYSSISGKSGATLKTALFNVIKNPSVTSYAGLWTSFQTTDRRSDGKVWDMYSDVPNGTPDYLYVFGNNQCGSYSGEGDCYNREHSFPKSWFNDASPMYSDLFHLYPTDGYVNGKRSNYPFGEVGIYTWKSSNGSKLGQNTSPGYTGTVFEPIDEYKGDFARTYFYMVTCYEDKVAGWVSNSEATPVLAGNKYPAFKDWVISLLLKWSRQDPVSQKEIDRNNRVYSIQNNRNPYIDYPELAEYVWGNKTSEPFSLDGPQISVSPSSGIDFGKNIPGITSSKSLSIKGYNLSGDLSLSIDGDNVSNFTVSSSSISKDNATAGVDVVVTYSSATVGLHSAVLTISGGGAAAAKVALSGQTSNDFLALPATNITSSSFTANWTKADNATGYVLDVYQLTQSGSQKQILFDYDMGDGFPSSWKTEGFTQMNEEPGTIRLASGNSSGAITTTAIGTSDPSLLTINAKQYKNDTGAALYVSLPGMDIDTLTTTSSFAGYKVSIPGGNALSTISLNAKKGIRVFISAVSLETKGVIEEKNSLVGYPVDLGSNILSFAVSNLTAGSRYFYTVTPVGGTDGISTPVEVQTATATGIDNPVSSSRIVVSNTSAGIVVRGIAEMTTIRIYDMSGKEVKRMVTATNPTFIPLQQKGGYIVSVQAEKDSQSVKISF
jgi:endonuclease I